MELIVFTLDERRFAIPLGAVHEILHAVTVVPLPTAPAIVQGVIDVRGDIVPVLDVRARFGLVHRPARSSDHFVLATAGARVVVLCADRVHGIQEVDEREIALASELVPGVRHVRGLFKDADGLVMIHELDVFLSHGEEVALSAALEGGLRG